MLNHALRNLPADRMRMHICWGNYEGPHHHDIPLEQLLPVVIKAKPQALLFEASNPRHAHEWTVFRKQKVPDDKILMPGVLSTTTNYIEHPELVAERICASPTSSAASVSSPARTAVSGPSAASGRWTRTSST